MSNQPEAIDSMLTDCMERLGGIDVFLRMRAMPIMEKIGPADWAKMEAISDKYFLRARLYAQKAVVGYKAQSTCIT